MNDMTAYFVGGPKHGDIDRIAAANEVRIPVSDSTWHDRNNWVNEGHYDFKPSASISYKTGIYRDSGELYGMPGLNTRDHNRLFVWQGVSR